MRARREGSFAGMGLRDKLKTSVKKVLNKFSGEFSAAETEIGSTPIPDVELPQGEGGDVKVTRARLKRPRDAKEG
ncbi:MAG: hypothetical protein ACOZNI_26650 [Myxococcota bacterium]